MKRFAKVISFLTLAAAGNLAAADFLPLAPGNSWTYRDAVTGDSFNVRVGTQIFVNQHAYHALDGYAEGQLYVRANQFGNLVYWDEERQQDVLLISFEYAQRAWFEAPRRQCPEEGQVREARAAHDGPAGNWNALEIEYRSFACADAGDILEQFTENVGMVRRVVSTIAGPRTYDLVHARLGHQVIAAGNTGSFSVSATAGPGTWLAALRLDLPYLAGSKLRFPSAQEYDLRLRDLRGNILWVWSADKLFAQATHELDIFGVWTANVVVPHPPAVPEGPPIQYTLEAWLTTADGEPRLGAVTIVESPRTITNAARAGRVRRR